MLGICTLNWTRIYMQTLYSDQICNLNGILLFNRNIKCTTKLCKKINSIWNHKCYNLLLLQFVNKGENLALLLKSYL